MTNAPKTVGLVHNGFGGWRLWTADDADDPTVVAVPYILASEHDRIVAEKDAEVARLKAERDEALRRRDEWRAKAEGYDAVRLALREKVGTPWPPHMSRLLWAGIAADEKKRADDAASEIERLHAAARDVVLAYLEANPMRTADIHPASCGCLRCEIDRLGTACGRDPCGALDAAAIRALIDKPGE